MRCAQVARMLAEGATAESGWEIVTITRGYTRADNELGIFLSLYQYPISAWYNQLNRSNGIWCFTF